MRIGIIQLDGKTKNIALEKIKLFYELNGDIVEYITPIESYGFDKIYCSSIYEFTDKRNVMPNWICGGTGFDLTTKLPVEIEAMTPKINIGFTTRGCVRNCKFCVIPKKEGRIYIVGDIYDFWDGKNKEIELLDNNIMALPKHFEKIFKQIKKEKLILKENGLDIRLLDKQKAEILSSIRHREYHFAFDNIGDEKYVKNGIELLAKAGIKRSCFYVLIGFNTTLEEDLYRINLLREYGQNVYVQKYNNTKLPRIKNELYSWTMQKHIFHTKTFDEYLIARNIK